MEEKINPETGEITEEPLARRSGPRTFSSWLIEQRKGALHSELTDGLAHVVQRCMELGKPGKITLTIDVKPTKDAVTLFVTDKVALKPPEADPVSALYFADEDGSLSRNDPRQTSLPIREVPRAEGMREVKE